MENNDYLKENQIIMNNSNIIDIVANANLEEKEIEIEEEKIELEDKKLELEDKKKEEINNKIDNECSICLDVFTPKNKPVKINSCGHKFHEKCLIKWLEIKPICPYCREDINGNFRIFIYKGSRIFPKKINLLIKVDNNNIFFYQNDKKKDIYKIISFSKLKKISLLNKKVFLIRYNNEQFYFNAKDSQMARIIYNVISTKFILFKGL